MRKIPQYIFMSLPPVKIFLEDIEKLDAIYRNNCKSYTICTEDYELDSLEELQQLGKSEFYKIKFQSQEPHISLEMLDDGTKIFAYEDDAASTGIVTKLKETLEIRCIKSRSDRNLWSWFPMIFFSVLSLSLSKNIINLDNQFQMNLVILLSIFAIIVFIIDVLISQAEHKKIPVFYMINQTPNKNFFIEYKNQIILLVIGGTITLSVQVLSQWIKQTLLDPTP
jgi:hypothetical protein